MNNISNDNGKMWDVFISHSFNNKEIYIEPLVSELQTAGFKCWYDSLEITSGDSLLDKLNKGLANSKVVLLCLSNNFLKGSWAQKELKAAIGLSTLDSGLIQLVPLMLEDPKPIIRAYPIALADIVYLKWEQGFDFIVDQLNRVISEVDGLGLEYWVQCARNAYLSKKYTKSLMYSNRAQNFNEKAFAAYLYHFASLLRLGKYDKVINLINKYSDLWKSISEIESKRPDGDTPLSMNVDLSVIDWLHGELTKRMTGYEIDDSNFIDTYLYFMGFGATVIDKFWEYYVRLYNKPGFSKHKGDIIHAVVISGKEDSWDWIKELINKERDESMRKALSFVLFLLCDKCSSRREDILLGVEVLFHDYFEKVREVALMALYFYSPNGAKYALEGLNDRSPGVREVSVNLLSGYTNISVDDNWRIKGGTRGNANPLLSDDIVISLLNDQDESVFDAIKEAITSGRVKTPKGIDIDQLTPPEREIVRAERVKTVAKDETSESLKQLIDFALYDTSDLVREFAIDSLLNNKMKVDSSTLRNLFNIETVSTVNDCLEKLIIEKGDDSIIDLLCIIVQRTNSTQKIEKSLEKIILFGDIEYVKSASHACLQKPNYYLLLNFLDDLNNLNLKDISSRVIEKCMANNLFDKLAANIFSIVKNSFIYEAEKIVCWSFDNYDYLEACILVSGTISNISSERIKTFLDSDSLPYQICALRSLEYRNRNNIYLNQLNTLFLEIKPFIKKRDWDKIDALLPLIDGLLEFSKKDGAIEKLNWLFNELNKDEEDSWVLRFTYDRLKALNQDVCHPIYDESDSIQVPPRWPDMNGPFYGIYNKVVNS